MPKRIFLIFSFVFCLSCVFLSGCATVPTKEGIPAFKVEELSFNGIKMVVIDPGHGGEDPGAIGRTGLKEKDVNLDIAKKLKKILAASGVGVVMTRSSDIFITLAQRCKIANNSGADIFISVHSNANHSKTLNGFEVYYVCPTVSDSKRASKAVGEVAGCFEKCLLADHPSDTRTILWDMFYTSSRAESMELAQNLCKVMQKNLGVNILGSKAGRYHVLRDTRMSAVLVETGFLSNYDEERKLKSSDYRQKIAEAIAIGLNEYAKNLPIMEAHKK